MKYLSFIILFSSNIFAQECGNIWDGPNKTKAIKLSRIAFNLEFDASSINLWSTVAVTTDKLQEMNKGDGPKFKLTFNNDKAVTYSSNRPPIELKTIEGGVNVYKKVKYDLGPISETQINLFKSQVVKSVDFVNIDYSKSTSKKKAEKWKNIVVCAQLRQDKMKGESPQTSLKSNAVYQGRNERPTAVLLRQLGELNQATGWIKNKDERWDSLPNTIPAHLSEKNKILLKHERTGLGIDNFIKFEFHEFKYGKDTFCLFVKFFREGRYEYPTISEGWMEYRVTHIYTFRKSELKSLKNLRNSSINEIDLNSFGFYEYNFRSLDENLNTFCKEFQIANEFTPRLHFVITPFKSRNVTQFLIYGMPYRNSTMSHPNYNKINYENPFEKQDLIKVGYFETSYLNFERLIQKL